jgi:hypothetical protein
MKARIRSSSATVAQGRARDRGDPEHRSITGGNEQRAAADPQRSDVSRMCPATTARWCWRVVTAGQQMYCRQEHFWSDSQCSGARLSQTVDPQVVGASPTPGAAHRSGHGSPRSALCGRQLDPATSAAHPRLKPSRPSLKSRRSTQRATRGRLVRSGHGRAPRSMGDADELSAGSLPTLRVRVSGRQ